MQIYQFPNHIYSRQKRKLECKLIQEIILFGKNYHQETDLTKLFNTGGGESNDFLITCANSKVETPCQFGEIIL